MQIRGEGGGLAERVAYLEEQLRNLQRLPGAVIPPALPVPGGGAGGGMREEMWASVSSTAFPVGTAKSTTPTIFDWSDLTSVGDAPPRIDPSAASALTLTASGFHLISVTASVGVFSIPPGRSVAVTLRVIRNGDTLGFVYAPLAGTFDDGVPQRDQRTVGAHLLAGDVLLADAYNTAVPTALLIGVTVGLSRIGEALPAAPALV